MSSPGRRSAIARVNLFSGEITFIGKRVHHDWSARRAPDTGIKRRYARSIFARRVVVTFAQGSVVNRALRQMFDIPMSKVLSIAISSMATISMREAVIACRSSPLTKASWPLNLLTNLRFVLQKH